MHVCGDWEHKRYSDITDSMNSVCTENQTMESRTENVDNGNDTPVSDKFCYISGGYDWCKVGSRS